MEQKARYKIRKGEKLNCAANKRTCCIVHLPESMEMGFRNWCIPYPTQLVWAMCSDDSFSSYPTDLPFHFSLPKWMLTLFLLYNFGILFVFPLFIPWKPKDLTHTVFKKNFAFKWQIIRMNLVGVTLWSVPMLWIVMHHVECNQEFLFAAVISVVNSTTIQFSGSRS